MTHYYLVNQDGRSAIGPVEMEKPDMTDPWFYSSGGRLFIESLYGEALVEYDNHLSSLPTIILSDELRDRVKPGEKVDGSLWRLEYQRAAPSGWVECTEREYKHPINEAMRRIVAFLATNEEKEGKEDDFGIDFFDIMKQFSVVRVQQEKGIALCFYHADVVKMLRLVTSPPSSMPAVGEAIEFVEWVEMSYEQLEKGLWQRSGSHTDNTYTTADLYTLFLNSKSKNI